MIRLLVRLFVKDRENTEEPRVRRAYGTMVSLTCILLNLLLFAGKFVAGTLAGSVSIRADAVNNLSDAGSSIVSLISFKISAKPADRNHPFGHARIEYVASMVVSFLVLFIGAELIRNSVEKLITPEPVRFNLFSVIVLGVSLLCKLWMAFLNRTVGKKINSEVMRATATDSLSDVGATGAVLLANLSALFLPDHIAQYADPIMGIVVALLILFAGCRILNETKNSILGEKPDLETVTTIKRVVSEYPDILGIHDLIIHYYGPGRTIASLHVEVDGKRDLFASHDTVDLIERRLRNEYHIECTIHLDPIITDDPKLDDWRQRTQEIVAELNPDIHIHDFRMVIGTTHTNLIFDMAVPFEYKGSVEELKKAVSEKITALDPCYFAVIDIDRV